MGGYGHLTRHAGRGRGEGGAAGQLILCLAVCIRTVSICLQHWYLGRHHQPPPTSHQLLPHYCHTTAATAPPHTQVEGDLALGDLGHGLPLRAGCFDGAISISAVQVRGEKALIYFIFLAFLLVAPLPAWRCRCGGRTLFILLF